MSLDVGVILDLETTGLNPESDHIIEIGLLKFLIVPGGSPVVVEAYGGIEDPKIPLSEEIKTLTGLSDEVLSGQSIEWDKVKSWLNTCSVVIAHNMPFDRSFLMRRPEMEGLRPHFACSLKHVDWKSKGFSSGKLTYLAADHGFINPFPHRALFDCATTFKLVAPHLDELMRRSLEREYVISAWESPFETKDVLKARGYRWDSDGRVWRRLVTESALVEERSFLETQVYKGGRLKHQEEFQIS